MATELTERAGVVVDGQFYELGRRFRDRKGGGGHKAAHILSLWILVLPSFTILMGNALVFTGVMPEIYGCRRWRKGRRVARPRSDITDGLCDLLLKTFRRFCCCLAIPAGAVGVLVTEFRNGFRDGIIIDALNNTGHIQPSQGNWTRYWEKVSGIECGWLVVVIGG